MMTRPRISIPSLMLAAALPLQANAALLLNTSVVGSFIPSAGGTPISANDVPNSTTNLRFGQLQADTAGTVEFFYAGSEAGYTNTLWLDAARLVSGVSSYSSTPGENFVAPDVLVGAISVAAGQFLDFGFCTSGGSMAGAAGRCAWNDDASTLTTQYNFLQNPGDEAGYRSIGFRALSSYNPTAGLAGMPASNYAPYDTVNGSLWGLFWDDSGASNDDDYDDLVAVARFSPVTNSVPEPSTLFLLGAALIGIATLGRRMKGSKSA
jgi:hypothetical protein